jgi:hypothetical protein
LVVVAKKWKPEPDGFLCADTKTGSSQTIILGCAWFRDKIFNPPLSPLSACLEEAPPVALEWKYIARHTSGGSHAYCGNERVSRVI